MPAYNEEEHIDTSIKSILCQTYKSFELIIVDDGSTDRTTDIISQFLDSPAVKSIRQKNAGTAAARNTGIKNASGEYIAFLDSDDIYTKNRLEIINSYLEKNQNTKIIATNVALWDGKAISQPLIDDSSGELTKDGLKLLSGVVFCTLVIRSDIFKKMGLFSDKFYYIEDVEMWHRIHAFGYNVHFINDCSYYYRRYGTINKTSSANSRGIQRDVIRINKKYLLYKNTPIPMRLHCLKALIGNTRKYLFNYVSYRNENLIPYN